MRSLFWRMFATFWLVSVALLVVLAWSTTSNFESAKIPGLGVSRLQAAMDDQLLHTAHELREAGVDGLRSWLRDTAGYGPGTIYVLDAQGRDLLGREVPPQAQAGRRSGAGRPKGGAPPRARRAGRRLPTMAGPLSRRIALPPTGPESRR